MVFVVAFAVPAELALAQDGEAALPANATAKSYGSGWDCDKGYRKNDEACDAVMVPANAYPTKSSYGAGWACQHGYKQSQDS